MADNIIITRAETPRDYERCARLLSENEPWLSLGRGYEYSLKKVQLPDAEIYVARAGDEVAGMLMLEMHSTLSALVRSLCVDGTFRSCGVGAQLLAHAESRVFAQAANVFIFCSSANPRAQSFYERHGYTVVGELKNYIVAGQDERLLRKTIGPKNEVEGLPQ